MAKRFKDFIFEKVNKQEINQILKDDSIYVGGEFEFFVNDVSTRGFPFDIDEAQSAWDTFYNDLHDWNVMVEEQFTIIQEERDELEDRKDELENDEIELDSKKDELEKNPEENSEEIEKVEEKILDIRKEIEDIEREIEEKVEERNVVFETIPLPVVPDILIRIDDELMGSDINWDDFENPFEVWENFDSVISELRRINPEFSMDDLLIDQDEILYEVRSMLESEIGLNVDVTGLSPKMGDDEWSLTTDASVPVDEGGVELISPPLPMPEFIGKMEEVFDFIDDHGFTDGRTGFHVHMSIKGIDLDKSLDVVKLFLFHDEEYTYNFFKERKGSHMAMSVKQKLQRPDFSFEDLEKIMKVDKLQKNLSTSKFYGINLSYIEKNHIEYRYMGGTGYEQKFDKIQSTLANYAFNLKLACDPQFKRQEYVKKLSKMINKKMEEKKPAIFLIVLCDYLQSIAPKRIDNPTALDKFIEALELIKERYSGRVDNMSVEDAVRSYKAMDFNKKEISKYMMSYIADEMVISQLVEMYSEIKEFLENIYNDPKKLMKGISARYKSIKPISKALK